VDSRRPAFSLLDKFTMIFIMCPFFLVRGLLENNFCCATRYFERRVNDLIKFNFPPTYPFSENLILEKCSSLGNESFAFGWMVEGVSNSLSWISYKDTFFRLRLSLSECNFFTYASYPQILRNDNVGLLPYHNSYEVVSKNLDDALFKMNATVSKA
jgi:hypothetical protein